MGVTIYPPTKSWEEALAPPKPLVKKINQTTTALTGFYFPTPDNDGSYIRLPTSYSDALARYSASGALVWSVTRTDLGVNDWASVFWLDTVDSAIWIWVFDTSATPYTYYLKKVALSNGAVTDVGSCQPGDGLFRDNYAGSYFERASMGSGDLTVRDGDQKIILSTADGSIVSGPTQVTQNGVAIYYNMGYQTADGTIYLTDLDYGSVAIMRGGCYQRVPLPPTSSGGSANAILWDGYVALWTTGTVMGPRFFNRTDFDDWLKRIADYYSFPE